MASPTAAVLRHPELRTFLANGFFFSASGTFLRAALGWHVFELTGSAFQLGLVGVVQFLPVIPVGLVGGAVADRFERRRILLLTQSVYLACLVTLATVTAAGPPPLPLLYALILTAAVATSIQNPTAAAVLPNLVPLADFPAAATVGSAVANLARGLGPVLMGAAVSVWDIGAAYALNAALVATALLFLLRVRPRPTAGHARGPLRWSSIREGLAFVFSRQPILGAMTLDMFAVFFASVTALLPIYATEILEVGALGYGVLNASVELGMTIMSLYLVARPPIERAGRALLWAVGLFGVATVIFGFSRSYPLSLLAMLVAGMADQVSVVSRHMIVQLATPDALRGRVSSVNLIFIGASNQLGAAESGFLAALTSATFSVVFGGLACLSALGVVALRMPELRRYGELGDHAEDPRDP